MSIQPSQRNSTKLGIMYAANGGIMVPSTTPKIRLRPGNSSRARANAVHDAAMPPAITLMPVTRMVLKK